ncbi:MAG: FlgD immunoglobulin-like domain containing protein [bacterium]
MKGFRFSVFLILVLIYSASIACGAIDNNDIAYAKNHLIILVHGIGDDHKCFDKVYDYLTKEAGLNGYVYRYEFSNQFLNIEKEGWEFGDRTYNNPEAVSKKNDDIGDNGNQRKPWEITKRLDNGQNGTGNSWLEQAKEDFKIWFHDYGPGSLSKPKRFPIDSTGPDNEIPKKFIVLGHSMGGLAVMSYMYGKDQRGNRYYQDDIEKFITIDTPHTGAGGASYARNTQEIHFYEGVVFLGGIGLSVYYAMNGNDELSKYFAVVGAYSLVSSSVNAGVRAFMNRYKSPALMDLLPDSDFIRNLNSADFGSYTPVKQRLIAGRGVPVPWRLNQAGTFLVGLNPISLMMASIANVFANPELDNFEGRFMGSYFTMLTGYPFFGDGDLVGERSSQLGEGIANLANAKRFTYTMRSPQLGALEHIIPAGLDIAFQFLPAPVRAVTYIGIAVAAVANFATVDQEDGALGFMFAHITMKDKIVLDGDPSLLEQALFDKPDVGSSTTSSVKPQALVLLTNQTKEADGKITTLSTTHTVEVKGYTFAGKDPTALPVVIDGKNQQITAITVKEAPTKIEGVLRDFMPKKMQYFQYSENFAAWKNITNIDEWGHFSVDGLKLAEGQNVLAFRGKNKVGYTSNQLLKIILNTIPFVASNLKPLPGTYTKNNKPAFSGDFGLATYSEDAINGLEITTAKMINGTEEVDVTSDVKATISGGDYDKHLHFEYTPKETLPDGEYSLVVTANSNVGVSQAVINVIIDTQAPTLAIQPLQPYSPRAPAIIKYTSSDEASPNLASVRCELYKTTDQRPQTEDQLVTTIATTDSISKGENFFNWSGEEGTGVRVVDGNYIIKITASDLAGNSVTSQTQITIDATPPTVLGVDVSPNPMTSNTTELGLTAKVNEKSTVIIKLNNLTTNSTTAYLAQSLPAPNGSTSSPSQPPRALSRDFELPTPNYLASYTWKYNDMFTKGPEDGLHRVEVIARDDAGNESLPRTLEAVRIDRTPPSIFGQITNPYVLSNIGNNSYKTNLSYSLTDAKSVKIKIYNSNTGQLVETIPSAPASNTAANNVAWNGSDQPKGAYRFQIIAEDDYGNVGIAYASCVKDGIAPVISYPLDDNTEVAGTISIRGTAIDPDWTNDKPFKDYRVYYRKGTSSTPLPLGEGTGVRVDGWQSDFIEVPQTNRDPQGPKNISIRPLQNNSTLAYLYTNNLANGDYTIKVEVNEENGETLSATRTVKVNNDSFTTSSLQNPYVKLNPVLSSVEFKGDDSVKLPLGFINSIKPANIYIEIIKPSRPSPRSGEGGPRASEASRVVDEAVVFSKYFPNIAGAPFIGKPDYKPGADLGYFIWSDDAGYHLRWSSNGSNHKFTGSIIAIGGELKNINAVNCSPSTTNALISWDKTMAGGESGIDFKISSGQIMITPKIDEDPTSPSITADNVYLGISKYSQTYLPIIIDAASQKLVDVTSMGKTSPTPNSELNTPNSLEWNGQYDTGAYVDNGTYIVRVRAEGADGVGMATDEAIVQVKTPFELSNLKVEPLDRKFSALGGIDRVSVFYNVSKDSIVTATVQKQNGDYVATLLNGTEVLGTTNPNNQLTFAWKGNYPDPDSGLVVPGGTYKIKLNVAAKDGSASETKEIDNITLAEFKNDAKIVSLSPIGENGIAQGDSPYYFEAKGLGWYHPPKDFSYTLTATGKQLITAYPFVPFAGLMHRGFKQVDINVEVLATVYYTKYNYVFLQGWKGEGQRTTKQHVQTFSLTSNIPSIEVKQIYDVLQFHDAALRGVGEPDGHVDKIDLTLVFRPAGDLTWVLDVVTIEANPAVSSILGKVNYPITALINGVFQVSTTTDDPAVASSYLGASQIATLSSSVPKYLVGTPEISEKGIFKVTPTWGTDGRSFGRSPYFTLTYQLEAPIAYSRLTNRFVPWFGFISAKTPESERTKDFSMYLTDINKGLGFPGKLFFTDPTAKPSAPYKDLKTDLQGKKNWGDLVAALNSEAQKSNLIGYKDSLASSVGYDSYLSGEYFEFIPITKPESGDFTETSSSTIKINTNLTYASGGNPPSPFEFSWPLTDQNKYDDIWKAKKAELLANPQKYTGTSPAGTWWELDADEVRARLADANNSRTGTGQVRFDKGVGKSIWSASQSFGQFLKVPNYVSDVNYQVASNTPGIKINPASGDKNTAYGAEDLDTIGVAWTTGDDNTLQPLAGKINSMALDFNENEFLGKREIKIANSYKVSPDYQSASALKYAFLKYDPFKNDGVTPIDNPNVVIDSWEINIKDKTGGDNRDLALVKINKNSRRLDDTFTLKLKLDASESRYVEIEGSASEPYELSYFDGKTWQAIERSDTGKNGRLAWWNVSRLNGQYTVLLRSGSFISTQDISIGTLVRDATGGQVYSTYKRAELSFPKGAFGQDKLVTITPVTMSEIFIRNRPIIMTSGPIVEIKPSPWKFTVSPSTSLGASTLEGVDQRPTLRFVYTFDDLADPKLGLWDMNKPLPNPGTNLGLPMNIHQVTAGGDLQIVSGNKQEVEINNGEHQYAFYAPLDHFSTYALLPGKFSLSAPMVFADNYITNKDKVTIYGTAEPGSVLSLYVKTENLPPDPAKEEPYFARLTAEAAAGNFKFENVNLLQEGNNYIFVSSHLEKDKNIRTISDVTIVKDTIAPSVEASQNLFAFSPNGDGKYDSVEYGVRSSEKGKIYFNIRPSPRSGEGGPRASEASRVVDEVISAEANKEVELSWIKDGFNLYRRDTLTGDWSLVTSKSLNEHLADGAYSTTVYAIDEAGNISNNVISQTVVDTTPPTIIGFNADPNPFTPNDDGVKDTTKIWYKFSEPAYVTTIVTKDDGRETRREFRSHEGPTEGFYYPTDKSSLRPFVSSSLGSWTWDGRGSRNELIGGAYSVEATVVDNVGNVSRFTLHDPLVVDREPTLVPYAYAEPDPFAPVNPNNSFTEIKYYLARDNVKVSAAIIGEGGKAIKILVNEEVQTKGEHALRWYGDFNSEYTGSTAVGNKYRVFDGSYEFQIKAIDPDGTNPATVTNTVLVDNVPPVITTKPLVVDYVKKQAKLLYQLPENSSVEVSVFDLAGNLISTLVTAEAQNAGEYTIVYEEPRISFSGSSYFKIVATDRAFNLSEVTTETFSVVPNQFQVSSNAAPNPFTPNADSLSDQTRISYNLAGGVGPYKVSLTILNAAGATVKRLVDNEQQTAGSYSFYWDGKDDGRKTIDDGRYECVISIQDMLETIHESRLTIHAISTRPTVDISTDIPIFSPNGDGAKDKVIFNYSINYPTFYITGEALVKIEVINSSAEAVWSKIFNNSAGNYVYEYNGLNSYDLPASPAGGPLNPGSYYVKISAQDALGTTAIPKIIPLEVDYSQPEPTDFSINTAYAKLDAEMRVKLNFPEPLAETPTVEVTMSDGTLKTAGLITAEGNNYEYSYIVLTEDAEGPAAVSVKARDLAFNPVLKTKIVTIDKTNPVVSNLSVAPNPAAVPAVNGQASIKFNVSEPLKEAPKVYVTQNGASPQLIPVTGLWSSVSGLCEAKYDVVPGYDGLAQVSIEVADLALNPALFTTSFEVDTVKPVFNNIKSEIGDNPEFTKFAKEGAEVLITFDSSEQLKFNPSVKVNEETAMFSRRFTGQTTEAYEYKYVIKNTDANGNANITISGFDFALNEGTVETSTSSESFVIDLVNPTIAIAEPQIVGAYISNPQSFSTNANPDGTDKPRSTTFYYNLAEKSKVTVKVYKVPDNQATYTKTDFNNDNLIKVLINDVWQEGNQTVAWDGKIDNNLATYDDNNDSYAMPGKYAFIVEGRDRANNLTLKKWGGTVWIQDNILTLREPEQFEYDAAHVNPGGNNPDPHYISPNGNSLDPAQKQAKYYFMIDLASNPTITKPAEKIEAQAVAGDTKKVGKYSIKVYSDSAMANLIRTVVANADAQSGTLTWEFWDGKNDAGQFVTDGTYYMVVDVKDFAGNSAVNNILKRTVVVDNEKPVISNLSAAPYYFSPGNTNSSIKTTTLTYEVADNGNSCEVTVAVYKGANLTKTLFGGWENNGTYLQVWDGTGDSVVDGPYTFKLSSTDQAGNIADIQTKEVVVDMTGPLVVLGGQAEEVWYSADNNITVSLSDNYSYQGFKWSWDDPPSTDPAGCNTSATGTTTHSSQGPRTLYVNAWDSAGNLTQTSKIYKRDYTPPTATFSGQAADAWYISDNQITISLSDTGGSDYRGFKWSWDNWPTNDPAGCNTATSASTTHASTGPRTLFVRVWDNAGNQTTYSKTYCRDPIRPSVYTPSTTTPTTNRRPTWSWAPSSDSLSGIDGYYIQIGTTSGGGNIVSETWVGNVNAWTTNRDLSSGTYYASIKAKDVAGNIGNWGSSGSVLIDLDSPVISSVSVSPNAISPGNADGNYDSITFSASANESSTFSVYVDGGLKYTSSPSINLSWTWSPGANISEGSHNYYIVAVDAVGNSSTSSTYSFTVDNTPPTINDIAFSRNIAFPDGINNSTTINCNVSGATRIDLEIRDAGGNVVRSFPNVGAEVNWDLKNNSGSFVPVGRYSALATVNDALLNVATLTATKKVRVKSRDEAIMIDDNSGANEYVRVIKVAKDGKSFNSASYWNTSVDWMLFTTLVDYQGNEKPMFVALRNQANDDVVIYDPRNRTASPLYSFDVPEDARLTGGDFNGDGVEELAVVNPANSWVYIYSLPSGTLVKSFKGYGNEIAAGDLDGDGMDELAMTIQNSLAVYLFKPSSIADGSAGNNSYRNWNTPRNVKTITCGDFNGDGIDEIALDGPIATIYVGWVNYVYTYNNSGTLINSFSFQDPSNEFFCITAGDFTGDGKAEIALMSGGAGEWMGIFKPMTGERLAFHWLDGSGCWRPSGGDVDGVYDFTTAYAVTRSPITHSITFEAPTLVAPTDKTDNVQSVRPTFEWKHKKGNATEYRIDVAKNDTFSIANQSFTKSPNSGSQDKADSTLYYYNYSIHEFDPGLDRDTYYWKVTALSTNEAATSETWSFTVKPDLTLSDVTNYPNPFNPNKEKTKIRYRLSTDASDVRIRIYDITGSLVNEIDGTTNGEGSSIWNKYNDVEWDGKNGRGDMVMNGIYPFEVTARIGDRSVGGRGKVAVLK